MAKKSGAQTGNNNAAKGKEWTDAIRYALANYENDHIKRGRALKEIALKLVGKCLEGDTIAMEKLGDRLEGKVAQGIIGEEDKPLNIIHRVERVIVDPKK